jgi:hypothetical protein
MDRPTHDYVAIAPCGCVVAICWDLGNAETARSVAEWIKDGCKVERWPLAQAAEAFKKGCPHQERTDGQGRTFRVGQEVTWTITTRKGKITIVRAPSGVITSFPLDDPNVAEVQRADNGKRKGPKLVIPLSTLTAKGEPTTLTRFMEVVRETPS